MLFRVSCEHHGHSWSHFEVQGVNLEVITQQNPPPRRFAPTKKFEFPTPSRFQKIRRTFKNPPIQRVPSPGKKTTPAVQPTPPPWINRRRHLCVTPPTWKLVENDGKWPGFNGEKTSGLFGVNNFFVGSNRLVLHDWCHINMLGRFFVEGSFSK